MEWHKPHFFIFLHISWMHFSHTLWAEFLFCPILIGKLVFYPQRHGHKMRSGTAKKSWIQLLFWSEFRSEVLKSFKRILLSSAKFRLEKLESTKKPTITKFVFQPFRSEFCRRKQNSFKTLKDFLSEKLKKR